MRNFKPTLLLILMVSLAAALRPAGGRVLLAQPPDPVAAWLTAVNTARLREGLAPYGFSTLLSTAAQRHADDIAAHGLNPANPHQSGDGALPPQRIEQAGYVAWKLDNGEAVVGETIWSGAPEDTPENGLVALLEDAAQRAILLSPVYREIGVGVAADADGMTYHVLTFGARPNVLPIFINDGAAVAEDPQIALHLTNEEARPEGQGTIFMGRAVEIRISDTPNFEGAEWQPWKPFVPWTLSETPGEHVVYVQFRDAAGRTAGATDSIFLGEEGVSAPTPIAPAAPPTAAPPTLPPADTGEPGPEAAIPTPIPSPAPPTPTPFYLPPTPSTLIPMFPTWTPLPTPTPPGAVESVSEPLPPWLAWLRAEALTLLLAMQGAAIILGLFLAFQRRRKGE